MAAGRIGILGFGSYVPSRVMTNDDWSELLDTDDEWIVTRTGIRERRFAADDESTLDLAAHAAEQALADAGLTAADIDEIIVATDTPEVYTPDTAAHLQHRLGAGEVTAYDLGMDPYMVHVLKAWIMDKTDGAWFGETVEGFFGWVTIAFAIIFSFRLIYRRRPLTPLTTYSRRHALVPLLIFLGMMVGQMFTGYPVESRTIAAFVMGIPLLSALAGWRYWMGRNTDQGL